MSDSTPNLTPEFAQPARRGGLLKLLLLLIVLAALGGGWRLWSKLHGATETLEAEDALIRRLSYQVRELEAQTEVLARRHDDVEGSGRRTAEQIAVLQNHDEASEQAIAKLDDILRGGRARFQLAAVEELLLLANDRVHLAHDAVGAAVALELADQRLAALADPRLTPVREVLAQERLALRAAPQLDLAGAALTLGGLVNRAPQWPLRTRLPEHNDSAVSSELGNQASTHLPAGSEWPMRVWASIKEALGTVFSVHRELRPVDRLLPPEQQTLIQQLLMLKLEGARIALLRQESTSYRDLLDGAYRWLADYYQTNDPGVLAASAELERLRMLNLNPSLPEPVKSLELLRAVIAK